MNILAIDTSTEYLSLAVIKDGKVAGRFHKKSSMRHSSLLVPMVDKTLKKAKIKIKDIDYFCISIGPGSFTGLRIGVVTVKGLAYALRKPVIAVPTLDVIAVNAASFRGIICPVLDARKNKVYACLYKSDGKTVKRISRYLLLPAADLLKRLSKYDKIIILGDAVHLIEGPIKDRALFHKVWHPRAEVAAKIALDFIKKKAFTTAEDLEPLYLYSRECDITGK